MQIRNKIIYPALLMLFMGLYFSSNAIACGGPGSPPCPVPPSIEAVPNAADFIAAPPPDFPPLPAGTEETPRWNLSDGVLEERLTTLKKLDRQILFTAKLIITGLDEGSTTHTNLTLEFLVEMLAERDDIYSAFLGRMQNKIDEIDSPWSRYSLNQGTRNLNIFIREVTRTTNIEEAIVYFDKYSVQDFYAIESQLPPL